MIKIQKPGLLASVQDLGRFGYQKYGVVVSGVMDQWAHRSANVLVGNVESAPSLEFTLLGPQLLFKEDALIAICGGDLSPTINGQQVPGWRPIYVKKGSELSFGPCRSGCRAYLAVAGGFDIPKVMGSASTYMRAGIGGFEGRALQSEDELSFGERSELSEKMIQQAQAIQVGSAWTKLPWLVTPELIPTTEEVTRIHVMAGREADWFQKEALEAFYTKTFTITPQSDRMGYRLSGPGLKLKSEREMISEAVNFGTIQVPTGGDPIILLADRQTTGGYPKIAHVITADLPKISQLKPGDKIQFQKVTHKDAQKSFLKMEKQMKQLKMGIALKWR